MVSYGNTGSISLAGGGTRKSNRFFKILLHITEEKHPIALNDIDKSESKIQLPIFYYDLKSDKPILLLDVETDRIREYDRDHTQNFKMKVIPHLGFILITSKGGEYVSRRFETIYKNLKEYGITPLETAIMILTALSDYLENCEGLEVRRIVLNTFIVDFRLMIRECMALEKTTNKMSRFITSDITDDELNLIIKANIHNLIRFYKK